MLSNTQTVDNRLIDVDTHFAEPPDLWTSRAPSKYKDRVLHVKQKDNGAQAWFIEGREVGIIGASVLKTDNTKELYVHTMPTFEAMGRASSYAPERLQLMDATGVSHQIIYPNIIGFGAQALMQMSPDVALRQWHVEAYNDAILDLQIQSKGRLRPQAALPLWDIDASLKELRRIRKNGLSGVVMSNKPEHFGQPPLGNKVWEPFFATCQDLGLPVNFHIGSGHGWEEGIERWWNEDKTVTRPDRSLNGPLAVFVSVSAFLNNSIDVSNLLLSGILERFPRLRFVSVESGVGWLPFLVQAIEYNWREMVTPSERGKFKRSIREMVAEQIFASYWFESRNAVEYFVSELGDNSIMFQTDFPHPCSLYPGVQDKAEETLGRLPAATRHKIMRGNAASVYNIAS